MKTARDLAELEGLTELQYRAAELGDFDAVMDCAWARQSVFEALGGSHPAREQLQRVAATNAQTIGILQEQLKRIGGELARLREGGKALHGYYVRVQSAPGFIDQVQ